MALENEIKIILKNITLSEFIKRIKKNNFIFDKKINQIDIYFDTKDWFLYENIAALRLRSVNNVDDSFSFKKVFYTPKRKNKYYIEEIEVKFPFNNVNLLKEIFTKLKINYKGEIFSSGKDLTKFLIKKSYDDEQIMPKVRQIFVRNNDEIVIDDIHNVGTIIELECKENNPLLIIKQILKKSEWKRSVEGTSYIWLKKVKGLSSHTKNLKRFVKDPMWNVWSNEIEMYQKINSK